MPLTGLTHPRHGSIGSLTCRQLSPDRTRRRLSVDRHSLSFGSLIMTRPRTVRHVRRARSEAARSEHRPPLPASFGAQSAQPCVLMRDERRFDQRTTHRVFAIPAVPHWVVAHRRNVMGSPRLVRRTGVRPGAQSAAPSGLTSGTSVVARDCLSPSEPHNARRWLTAPGSGSRRPSAH